MRTTLSVEQASLPAMWAVPPTVQVSAVLNGPVPVLSKPTLKLDKSHGDVGLAVVAAMAWVTISATVAVASEALRNRRNNALAG